MEKQQIARRLILSSPVGELSQVIADVKALLGDDGMDEEALQGVLRDYHHKNLSVATGSGDQRVLLSEESERGNTVYIDYATNSVYVVDPLQLKIVSSDGVSESEIDGKVEDLRLPLQKEISEYLKSSVSSGWSCVKGSVVGDEQMMFLILISGSKLNAKNFWNGRWTSRWTVKVDVSARSGAVEGEVESMVHYYEDGNVQMEAKTLCSAKIVWDDKTSFARAVCKAVREQEEQYHRHLEESQAITAESAFKSLRRKMPITQTKFQWDKVAAYSLARELTSK
uniref:F-actin-capping protein subunit alpha n=1 Tax=Hanusia phi TaxID=3032 RepID=A0A7S0F4E7_9CRYP|mmetsp:Transcript_3963/g.9722  ORF Transcript_3963/g.9722 Transcript_3963/m.9722 type:complete len:282 (+) Transcript_3963:16-861(+)